MLMANGSDSDSEWCRVVLQRTLADRALLGTETVSMEVLEVLENQLKLLYRELACLEVLGNLSGEQMISLRCTGQALDEIQNLLSTADEPIISRYVVTATEFSGCIGRPRYDIPRSQLEYLLQNRFTVPQISSLLCVSVRTVRRRMEEYDLSVRIFYRDHGPGRGSFIIRVNNSRIERFWRDLFRGCTLLY